MGSIKDAFFSKADQLKERSLLPEKPAAKKQERTYMTKPNAPKPQNRQAPRNDASNAAKQDAATAPYNFVSLPNSVIASELDKYIQGKEAKDVQAAYKEYLRTQACNTGHIELTIETLTPCFIGGEGESFFAPAGTPMIPGSALRGMTKNIFKMVTCGAMRPQEDIDDRHLYFRCLMAPNKFPRLKKLHVYYQRRMTYKKGDDLCKKTKPGFLVKRNEEFFICPAQCTSKPFGAEPQPPKAKIVWHDDKGKCFVDCFTGANKLKTSYRVIHDADWHELKPVPKEVVEDYQNDQNRKGIDLFKEAKKDGQAAGFTKRRDISLVAPCFYVEQDGVVQHFGHGRSYRIPYEKSIASHIPRRIKAEETIDFADAVFGKKAKWASRVFFDDAPLQNSATPMAAAYAKMLLSPNPTAFQLYLQQRGGDPQHWDDDANIRGYKLYWHQKIAASGWKIGASDTPIKEQEKIAPLAKGCIFHGKIRFTALSNVELGAMLRVFYLDDGGRNICYKLGRGKSLGMGSVKITAKLFLSDEAARYRTLFDESGWQEAIAESDARPYLTEFVNFFNKALANSDDKAQYAQMMEELTMLLDWENTQKQTWPKTTAYMENADPRYLNRMALPTPQAVVKS